jgi:hypothetical protein
MDETLAMLGLVAGNGGGTLYSVVLQPGGTPGPNVFTSWATLYAAMAVIHGGARVTVNDQVAPAHMTAGGPYALNGWEFVPINEATTNLIIDAGVTIAPTPGGLIIGNGLSVTCNATSAVITDTTAAGSLIILRDNCFLECTAAGEFIAASAQSPTLMLLSNDAAIGDRTHAVTSGPLIVQAVDHSSIQPNALGVGFNVLWVDASSNPGNAPATLIDKATGVLYSAATPAQWGATPPIQVGGTATTGALDRIAAVMSNHAQSTGAVGAANPAIFGAAAFTCKGTGLKVRVDANAVASSAFEGIDTCTMTLRLDGSTVVGAPAPAPGVTTATPTTFALSWDVTFTAGAHTVSIAITSGASQNVTIQEATIRLQELLS